ncbi:hypothetical protein HRbin36_01344 [bacterium HR36]|uniref:Hypothetical conserved protein n=1 Tax=uncultured Planctomycetota bacterium TaxID=120965 RepID=H5S876_9BACT|nr:hypothetical conserved protein [uncultured Planctomycetota bacterium]GBD36223.1 hypothetical protein HRbin36_01344 [bacterium HR36]
MKRALCVLVVGTGWLWGCTAVQGQEQVSFGRIKPPAPEQIRAQLFTWLKEQAKVDGEKLRQAETLWAAESRPVLARVAEILALGSPEAQRLLEQAANPEAIMPTEVPALIRQSADPFFKANLGLAYARLLCLRKAYEEALEVLKLVRPEHVVDPGAYYFYRAVAEHKTLNREETLRSVDRLFDQVEGVPERYFVLASLLKYDLQSWDGRKNLDYVARRMDEISGRLDNARGGPKTQAKQKEILDLLSKMIDQLEQQLQQQQAGAGQGGGGQGGGRSSGGPPGGGTTRSSGPATDSGILGGAGEGKVDMKELIKRPDLWGKLPEKERVKVLEAVRREYPPHIAEAIEAYLQQIAKSSEPR